MSTKQEHGETLVVRKPKRIGLGSIITFEGFKEGEFLHGVCPHRADNGEIHKGNMRVYELLDMLGFSARAACVMKDCDVETVVRGMSQSTETFEL